MGREAPADRCDPLNRAENIGSDVNSDSLQDLRTAIQALRLELQSQSTDNSGGPNQLGFQNNMHFFDAAKTYAHMLSLPLCVARPKSVCHLNTVVACGAAPSPSLKMLLCASLLSASAGPIVKSTQSWSLHMVSKVNNRCWSCLVNF